MKWNWGTKIALLYSTFIGFILFLVYLSFNQRYDLVTEDYYEEEINYQSTIDSKARAEKLDDPLKTFIEGNNLKIVFPQEGEAISGVINCFRPSDEAKDFSSEIKSKDGTFSIPLRQFIKGKYLLKVNWVVNSTKYYQEQTVIIP